MNSRIDNPDDGEPRLSHGDIPIRYIVEAVGGGIHSIPEFSDEHDIHEEDVTMAIAWTLDHEEEVCEAIEMYAESLSDSELEEYLDLAGTALERVLDGTYRYAEDQWHEADR